MASFQTASCAGTTPANVFDILVIGSLVCDISCTFMRAGSDDTVNPRTGSSNPARIMQCVGGVAHNIGLASHYLGHSVLLVSVVGKDAAGDFLLREVDKEGLATEGIIRLEATQEFDEVRTGQYVGNYNAERDLIFGMADVELMLHPETQNESAWRALLKDTQPKIIVLDTTFSHATIDIITSLANDICVPVILDPVSQPLSEGLPKSLTFKNAQSVLPRHRLDVVTPNAEELAAMVRGCVYAKLFSWEDISKTKASVKEAILKSGTGLLSSLWPELSATILNVICILPYVPVILVTLGSRGCLLAVRMRKVPELAKSGLEKKVIHVEIAGEMYHIFLEWWPAVTHLHTSEVVSVNGAGDSLVGAFAVKLIAALAEHSLPVHGHRSELNDIIPLQAWKDIIQFSQWAAIATLRSDQAVSPKVKDLRQHLLGNLQDQTECEKLRVSLEL